MLGGFIAAVVAVIVALVAFLSNLNIFSDMASMGFGPWINNFFAHITAQKVVFFIAVAVFIIGVVLYFKGRKAAKKAGEERNSSDRRWNRSRIGTCDYGDGTGQRGG